MMDTPGEIIAYFHLKVNNFPSSTINPYVQVDISDALSEKDKVKFTVHTRTGRQFAW